MKFFGLIRKLKGWYFLLKLHVITPDQLFEFASNISKLSKWISKQSGVKYSDFYTSHFDYNKRYDLYTQIIEKENLNSAIDYLEFGVASGKSFKWWVDNISNKDAKFYGFDTFTGLPENWGPYKKGDMSSNNKIPELNDDRCKFYQGLFQQTVPSFLASYKPNARRVIFMDADLYSSTLFVLSTLTQIMREGDLIFFDEFNVPQHEFKAFSEWANSFYIDYEVIGAINNFYQIAVKITKMPASLQSRV